MPFQKEPARRSRREGRLFKGATHCREGNLFTQAIGRRQANGIAATLAYKPYRRLRIWDANAGMTGTCRRNLQKTSIRASCLPCTHGSCPVLARAVFRTCMEEAGCKRTSYQAYMLSMASYNSCLPLVCLGSPFCLAYATTSSSVSLPASNSFPLPLSNDA